MVVQRLCPGVLLPRGLPMRPWEAGAWTGIRAEGGAQASVLGPAFVDFPVPRRCANHRCQEVKPFTMCSARPCSEWLLTNRTLRKGPGGHGRILTHEEFLGSCCTKPSNQITVMCGERKRSWKKVGKNKAEKKLKKPKQRKRKESRQ